MRNKKFFGLYCGYSHEDIMQMIKEIDKKGDTFLMDNYTIRKVKKGFIMEDKWEAESPKILHGEIEKIVLDALSLEFTGKKSRFQTLNNLTNYMVREEAQDMESYLRHENEWEY